MVNRKNQLRIPCETDRRRKVCNMKEEEIKRLRNEEHMTFEKIAEKMNLSENTLYRTIYPEIREKAIEAVSKRNTQRYHEDEEFRKNLIKTVCETQKKKWRNDPEFRKRRMEYHNKYMKDHPEKRQEYQRRRSEKMKERKNVQ